MEQPTSFSRPKVSLATDCVVFGFDGYRIKVLLIKRKINPFLGMWAFPGGFMLEHETLNECAVRELHEETGLHPYFLEQFHAFSDIDRDPRGRVVSVAYFCLMPTAQVQGGSDAEEAQWFDIHELPEMAFDHKEIFNMAQSRLRERIYFEPIAFGLLDKKFTMSELQRVYEVVLDVQFDRRNFQKKMLASNIIVPLDEQRRSENGPSRPATLYSFKKKDYHSFKNSMGFSLEF